MYLCTLQVPVFRIRNRLRNTGGYSRKNLRKQALVGRNPARLKQKAEYFFPLVLVQAGWVKGAGNLATPLQGVIAQQARLIRGEEEGGELKIPKP